MIPVSCSPCLVLHSGIQSVKPHNWLITAQSREYTVQWPHRSARASQQTALASSEPLWDDLLPRLPQAAQQMRSCLSIINWWIITILGHSRLGPPDPIHWFREILLPWINSGWAVKIFMKGFEESPEILRGKMWLWGLRAQVLPTVGWAGSGRSCWKIKASKF